VAHAFAHLSPGSSATRLSNRFTLQVRLMGASHDILREVVTSERFQQTKIAMVSRCDYPPWAAACMRLFEAAPGVTLADATTYSVHSAIERLLMYTCWW
jgi:Acid Phosphatase